MERGSTLFLRATIIGMGLAVLAICATMLPAIYTNWHEVFPDITFTRFPAMIGLSITALAFFVALYQAFKLLDYIDSDTAFSESSIDALRIIKYCALTISAVYVIALPFFYNVAQYSDAPGLMVIGMFCAFAPIVICVFAALMQRLLMSIIAIKSENDLTV